MADFRLLNYSLLSHLDEVRPGILVGHSNIFDLRDAMPSVQWSSSTLAVLNAWEESLPALHALAEAPLRSAISLDRVKLRAPLLYPPAIYCAAANYRAHAMEMSPEVKGIDKSTTQPYIFLKSGPHCVISSGDAIRLPTITKELDWEGELAVVIGKRARNVGVDDAMSYGAGYTVMNELSARDLGRRADWPRFAVDWFGHKNFDDAARWGRGSHPQTR